MSSALRQLYEDIADRLAADHWFAVRGITVLTERPRVASVEGEMEHSLDKIIAILTGADAQASKHGVVVVVQMPTGHVRTPNVPRPYFDLVRVQVLVLENPLVNYLATGTNSSAEEIAERILAVCHQFNAALVNNTLVADEQALVPVPAEIAGVGIVGYSVNFRTSFALADAARVATPSITVADGLVSIACATAGAALWYTVDGSYPWEGNETATEYAGPFDEPGAGALLRVGGFAAEHAPSDVAARQF
jgi:hypothetical protein